MDSATTHNLPESNNCKDQNKKTYQHYVNVSREKICHMYIAQEQHIPSLNHLHEIGHLKIR